MTNREMKLNRIKRLQEAIKLRNNQMQDISNEISRMKNLCTVYTKEDMLAKIYENIRLLEQESSDIEKDLSLDKEMLSILLGV